MSKATIHCPKCGACNPVRHAASKARAQSNSIARSADRPSVVIALAITVGFAIVGMVLAASVLIFSGFRLETVTVAYIVFGFSSTFGAALAWVAQAITKGKPNQDTVESIHSYVCLSCGHTWKLDTAEEEKPFPDKEPTTAVSRPLVVGITRQIPTPVSVNENQNSKPNEATNLMGDETTECCHGKRYGYCPLCNPRAYKKMFGDWETD